MFETVDYSPKNDFLSEVESFEEHLRDLEEEKNYQNLLKDFCNTWEQIGLRLDKIWAITRQSKNDDRLEMLLDLHNPALEFCRETYLILSKKQRKSEVILESDVRKEEMENSIHELTTLCREMKIMAEYIPEPTQEAHEPTEEEPVPSDQIVEKQQETFFDKIKGLLGWFKEPK